MSAESRGDHQAPHLLFYSSPQFVLQFIAGLVDMFQLFYSPAHEIQNQLKSDLRIQAPNHSARDITTLFVAAPATPGQSGLCLQITILRFRGSYNQKLEAAATETRRT